MIFDCFPFFNELELLDIRLHELYDVVDYFVLIEADRTHSGRHKPLYFNDNWEMFMEFRPQIIHIIVKDMPMTHEEINASLSSKDRHWIESKYQVEDSWVRERFQRNAMMRALDHWAKPDDIIIIEDADEMVKKSLLENIEDTICEGSNAVEQSLRSFYLNVECTNMPWSGSKIIRKKYIETPSEVRFHTPPTCSPKNGGWHFAWLGGAERIQLKLKSYAHTEFNKKEFTNLDHIQSQLEHKKDVLNRLYEYDEVEMNEENMPKYVLDNLDKFEHLIYRGE